MGRYDGRKVLIIGGASGIGFATAKLLVDEGARVMVTGRDEKALQAAQQSLGDMASIVVSDMSVLADIEVLAGKVAADFDKVDLLFINAAIAGFAPLSAVSEAAYDEMMAINLKGPYFTVQRLAPIIVRGGSIVLTTSVANVMGMLYSSLYAATKAGLRSLARTLGRELLASDIRVNAVSPGPIDTGILEKMMDEESAIQTKQQMTDENPMKRFGRPEEVARAVVFLAFDATYTTGTELAVDGGGAQL